VIFGGQARRFTVRARPGVHRTSDLRIDRRLGFPLSVTVLRRASVGRARALVVRVPKVRSRNSGHVVVLWNVGSAGWLTSVHLDGLSLARRIATAVALARGVR
jgi:hypothetical protein